MIYFLSVEFFICIRHVPNEILILILRSVLQFMLQTECNKLEIKSQDSKSKYTVREKELDNLLKQA